MGGPDDSRHPLVYGLIHAVVPVLCLLIGIVLTIGPGAFLGRDGSFLLLTGLIYAWLVMGAGMTLHPFSLVVCGVLFDILSGGIPGGASLLWGGLGCLVRGACQRWFVWPYIWMNWGLAAAVLMMVAVLCWLLMSMLEVTFFSFRPLVRAWLLAWLAWPLLAWLVVRLRAIVEVPA